MRPPADLILIQEPFFGKVGTNSKMAQGNPQYDVYGCPKHKDWQAIVPPGSSSTNRPDVIFYVPSRRSKWTFQLRSDIISSMHLMCMEINSSSPPFMVFNVYNDVDNNAVKAMKTLDSVLPRSIFLGDFNLHHPIWSRDDNLDKHGEKADELVKIFEENSYNILNKRGEDTFFVYRTPSNGGPPHLYTSTLDLAWASPELLPLVSKFEVAKHLGSGSDHHPLVTTISYSNKVDDRPSFVFTDDKFDDWSSRFKLELSSRPEIPESIKTKDDFNTAVDSLQGATLAASQAICSRKVKPPRAARWFDSKVREALKDMRLARKRMVQCPSKHMAMRYTVARKQFHYQIVLSKRSHARHFAANVKPGADLWRLNTWYQGVRKTTVPTLKEPTSDPKFPIWVSDSKDKAKLLAESWFPNNKPIIDPPPHPHMKVPTREFTSITDEEIAEALADTSNTTAPGISGLNYKVWKWVHTVAPDQLVSIIRASVRLGIHHHSWKQSLVAVIPKNNKKDMALPKSHRPIQLIECLGKLVEKIVAKRFTFALGKYELMPFNQFGGRSNSSCLDAGLSLTHDIQQARMNGLVSSFLAVDIKGFFDHADHDRIIDVLHHKGFSPNEIDWTRSFLQDRFVRVQVDDHVGDPHPQNVGFPQGSPISPVLACIYSSIVLEYLNLHPIFDETGDNSVPIAPKAYVDDFGFHAASSDLASNMVTLKETLNVAVGILTKIGMSIDPDKCDLIHFSWKRGDNESPPLKTVLYGKPLTITPPSSIRWLGFHLDRKLSFSHHVNLLAKKGNAIVSGLKVLGNTIEGISPANLRLLYKTVVIPAITYGSQLWFNPTKPNKKLLRPLERVQHRALINIAGAFWDSQEEALQMLTYVPPLTTTLTKLYRSAALRFPRLPISSEISRRLPLYHIPSDVPLTSRIIPPKHIPFRRPTRKEVHSKSASPLSRMASTFQEHTERALPFHSQNAPHSLRLSTLPFAGRLFISPEACARKDRKSLITEQRIWLNTKQGRDTLVIFTDGSKTDKAAGWAITGIHAGQILFTHKVPLAKKASNHDAEMYALSHASKLVRETMLGTPHLREFRIFSDSTSALTSIFSPSPHPAQQASLTFRSNMLWLFSERKDITGRLVWTPGHGGLDYMTLTDKNAKAAANHKIRSNQYLLPLFVSRSSALSELEAQALKEWNSFLNDLEDSDAKIFRSQSGFFPFAHSRKGSSFIRLRPPKWFKSINRKLMSQLTQMCTNHAPTGEYFKRHVWKYKDKPPSFFQCPCKNSDNNPPLLQTREHIIKSCPLFEDARNRLNCKIPGIIKTRSSIGRLVKVKLIEHTLEFLKTGPFSRRFAPYEPP